MADVFLSYASDDRERVRPLVAFLEARGWSVWWDRALRPGEAWPDVIGRELDRARCVVVAWSRHATDSPWVRLEANHARERGKLVPLILDAVAVPPEFGALQWLKCPETTDDEAQAALGEAVAGHIRRFRARIGMIAAGIAVVVAVALALGICRLDGRCRVVGEATELPELSVAVLPATIELDESSARPLIEELVDDLRRTLRRAALDVSSRAETAALPAQASPVEAGARLRVRWLLVLTFRGDAHELRVLAELLDARTGYLRDDWTLSAPRNGLAALNTQLARTVVARFVDDADARVVDPLGPGEAYTLYLEGRALLREGSGDAQLAAAERAFRDLLARWPQFARAEASLCQLELIRYENTRAVDRLEAGQRHCERALTLDASTGEAEISLGQLHFHRGDYAAAAAAFGRAVAQLDVAGDAYIGLGRVAVAEGRIADAEHWFQAAVSAEPRYWRTHTELGNFLFDGGRGPEAAQQHREAITLARADGVTLNNLGASLFLSGQLEAAIAAWQAALALSEQAPTYSNLGAAHILAGEFDQAVAMYERSVALSPEDFRVWSNLGDALHFAGRSDLAAFTRAAALAERELASRPDDAVVQAGLAAIHAALGDVDAARDYLTRATAQRAAPDWQVAYLVAVTYLRLGDVEAARRNVEEVLAAGYPAVLISKDPALAGATAGVIGEATP